MLGLIAFALLILACSYWKLSGYLDNAENTEETGEANEVKQEVKDGSQSQYYSEVRLVVIMAGEEKPTFLATPISSKSTSSLGEGNNGNNVVVIIEIQQYNAW
ncbi:hypothetical protein J5N97_026806 [Dioscorea zingiberensis]|uniref:Uncharacterized protein n=1 Tax=Dioscorea zingiberensis TaxID=325984 RepID=A0A9D5C3V3_9LILI|nr:hypothetical protein J5N97_026806 [Dioscorea zingiberensis]